MRAKVSTVLFSSILSAATAWAQKIDSAITIGTSATLWSDRLQEERKIFVYLPPGYETTGDRIDQIARGEE